MSLIKYQNVGSHRVEQRMDSICDTPVWPVYIDGHLCPLTFDQAISYLQGAQDKSKSPEKKDVDN